MSERIDVVIVARNRERELEACCKTVLKRVPANNLIIVVGKSIDNTLEIAKRFADVLVEDEGKGVGYARGLGLEYVQTDFYASIDTDVRICPEWYSWCFKTMYEDLFVGACEGYTKPFGHFYYKYQRMIGEPYCSLGNTLLRTKLIKEVGMPNEPCGEDWRLRERIEKRNYKWVVNFDLISTHLVNDIDIFRHYIDFGKHRKKTGLVTLLKELGLSFKEFMKPKEIAEINYRIYVLILRLSFTYGSILGKGVKSILN